jgi:hypothetical protein
VADDVIRWSVSGSLWGHSSEWINAYLGTVDLSSAQRLKRHVLPFAVVWSAMLRDEEQGED